ncbi:MAG TPA: hypothetical protein VG734_19435 [Lacunisphaera sp.]|nr:hypothetical protein [Lacunisphaera sp.]
MNDPITLATAIEMNAQDFWFARITYEAFSLRGRQLWDRATAAGLADQVRRLLPVNQLN